MGCACVQVVLGPHVYGPSVSGATTGYTGPQLWDRLTASFGSKAGTGFCHQGACNKFAVVLGEFGTRYVDVNGADLSADQSYQRYDVAWQQQVTQDSLWLNSLAAYIQKLDASASNHNPMVNWIFQAWSTLDASTSGLAGDLFIHDRGSSYINWDKVQKLVGSGPGATDGFNLRPFYYGIAPYDPSAAAPYNAYNRT